MRKVRLRACLLLPFVMTQKAGISYWHFSQGSNNMQFCARSQKASLLKLKLWASGVQREKHWPENRFKMGTFTEAFLLAP